MMLWVTLTVAASISNTLGDQGTLGGLAGNTSTAGNIAALFSFLIILGLLFASFKLASSFSSGISGFGLAALVPALGFGLAARAAGVLGRQTVGRGAYAASERLKTGAQNAKDGSFRQSLYKFGSKGFKGVASSDMNAMRTLGSPIAKTTGLSMDALAGKPVKGFEGSLKQRAKGYAHDADMLHVDSKKQKDIAEEAVKAELGKNSALGERHSEATQALEVHTKALKDAEKAQASAVENMTKAIKDAQQKVDGASSGTEKDAAKAAMETTRGQHETQLKEQAARISRATKDLGHAESTVKSIAEEAKLSAIAKGDLKKYASEADLGATLSHNRYTNTLARLTGWNDKDTDRLAQLTKKEVGEHHETKEAKKIVKYLKNTTEEDTHGDSRAKAPTNSPAAQHESSSKPAKSDDGHGTEHH